MKNISANILVILGLQASAFAVGLLPKGHFTCLNHGIGIPCDEGTSYRENSAGNCACLSEEDYYDARTCKVAVIGCEEGQSFFDLYSVKTTVSGLKKKFAGCGCFSVVTPEVYPF